jgi:hypothetical protein
VQADNDQRHVVGGRAVSERGHTIEDVLLHFPERPEGGFARDFAEPSVGALVSEFATQAS